MSPSDNILDRLKATRGDVQAQAAVMAEFLLSSRPEDERKSLRETLDTAAILHWFDPHLLQQVLEIPPEEAASRFEKLKTLHFVELSGRGESRRHNVHDATRIGWRRRLANETPERFRYLSSRAANCFSQDRTASGRIEWIYHLLCADPEAGASALEELNREWSSSARLEDRAALAFALAELEASDLVQGRARARSLLAIAWTRDSRGETAQLADVAEEALRPAIETGDRCAEADAQSLRGDVLVAQGNLDAAMEAYDECLTIRQRLVEQDPSNAGWQRDLAVAHGRVGGVLEALGKLEAAQAAFAEYKRRILSLGAGLQTSKLATTEGPNSGLTAYVHISSWDKIESNRSQPYAHRSFTESYLGKVDLDTSNQSAVIFADGFRITPSQSVLKRVFDVIGSIALLLFTLPLMVLTALAILIESRGHGPVFYTQERVGQGGRLFKVIKFRSMYTDTEKSGEPPYAQENDPRVTKVGRILRDLRIDELPQVINVLRGEMSLVGPRPERPKFVRRYLASIPYYGLRHHTKPGMTGWAQISYRYGSDERDAREKLQYDLYYLTHFSFLLDLKILLRTVHVWLAGSGAR